MQPNNCDPREVSTTLDRRELPSQANARLDDAYLAVEEVMRERESRNHSRGLVRRVTAAVKEHRDAEAALFY